MRKLRLQLFNEKLMYKLLMFIVNSLCYEIIKSMLRLLKPELSQ